MRFARLPGSQWDAPQTTGLISSAAPASESPSTASRTSCKPASDRPFRDFSRETAPRAACLEARARFWLLERRGNRRVVDHLDEAQIQAAGGKSAISWDKLDIHPAGVARGKRQQHARWNGECASARGNKAGEIRPVVVGVLGGAIPLNLKNVIRATAAPGEGQAVGASHVNAGPVRWIGQGGGRGNGVRRGETADVRSSRCSDSVGARRKKSASGGQRD